MKNMNYVILLAILLIPGLTFSADLKRLPTSSRITAVTVYSDRALTTRTASLNLKPGSHLLTFDNLPTLIQDDSVRVEGTGTAGITIVGLEIKRTFLEQSGEKQIKEIDEEIRRLEQNLGALDAKKLGLTSQKAFLESIRVAWGDRISKELAIGRPTRAELQEAATFVGSGVTTVADQTFTLDMEKRNIGDKIDSLRRVRDESTGSHRKETKSVEVMVDAAHSGSLTLNLATVTPQAGWLPSYDVRLATDTKTAELTFRALVRQQTGEDWNNVNVTLSTARPAAGGAPPELHPWHISLFSPQPRVATAMLLGAAPDAGATYRKSGRTYAKSTAAEYMYDEEAPAEFETAQISTDQSSVSFHIPRPLDIPSDGTLHASIVAVEQLPVTMEFLAIPKLSPSVFLKSEIVNKGAYTLLPGKVNTFVGSTFTGSSQLKKVAAGEKFDLFFGADDQVTVTREELKQHKEAGIFGKNRISYQYRIIMNNFRAEPLILTLRDQLPLAGDEEIKVSLDQPSVKPEESGSDGRITWKTLLKPNEKQELTFGILVEYPKNREISGL